MLIFGYFWKGFRICITKYGITKKSKGKHRTGARQRPVNEISNDDVNFFIHRLEEKLESGEYPKLRHLEKILKPNLSSQKIIAVLGYLQRSRMIEVDLDGNIIWIRHDAKSVESGTLIDSAVMSEDFRKLIQDPKQHHAD